MTRNLDRRSFLNCGAATAGLIASGGIGRVWAGSAAPIVETAAGKIRGSFDGRVLAFKGVPYGASTAGNLRFLPPAKPQGWTGVRDSLELGLRAPQLPANLVPEFGVMDRTGPMGEDCLSVNIWTQGLKDGHKRPVMVWLHGGGFSTGSANFTVYDGANLAAKHDVVLVGVNHRLNIFGFLYLADLGGEKFAQASNAGMLDIVAALEWVRDNIANFGGDPNNVTIFGQSGGGGKVSTLLGMPAAKGLFHRAIAQSGSEVRGVSRSDATESAEMLVKKLGLDKSRLDELQKVPLQQLLDVTAVPRGAPASAGNPALRLTPVVDGSSLPAHPFDPVATSISAGIPLMIGSTETEVTWNPNTNYDPLDNAALRDRVKQSLRVDQEAADRVINVYRKNRPKVSNLDLYLILASDASNFRTGTDTEAERKAALGKAPVYKYYFQWYSPVREGKLRSMHTMDIPFVFENVEIAKTEIGEGPDLHPLAEKMSGAWVAFARTGSPNHKGLPNWAAFTPNQRATMIFNKECRVVNDPYGEEKAAIRAAQPARS